MIYGFSVDRLDELNDEVDVSTTSAVEDVRVAVMRLKGMASEASTLASQLAAARRHRIICVDRHRRRQLPQLPAVDLGPTSPLKPGDVDSESRSSSDFTASTTIEAEPREDACRRPSTSPASDLLGVVDHHHPVQPPRDGGTQWTPRPAEVLADRDHHVTGDVTHYVLNGSRRQQIDRAKRRLDKEVGLSGTDDHAVASTTAGTVNPEPRRSSAATPNRDCPVISQLVNFARETTMVRHLSGSLHESAACIVRRWNNVENTPASTRSGRIRGPSHVTAVLLTAAVILCLAFISYCEQSCESSSERTSSRTSWLASVWNKRGLQYRHIVPPPV